MDLSKLTHVEQARSGGAGLPDRSAVLPFVVVAICLLVGTAGIAGLAAADHGDDGSGPVPAPAAYYGDVTVNGEPAPVGTEIVAMVNGEPHGSIEVTEAGQYGGPDALDRKLVVRKAESGDEVTFIVRDTTAAETATWESGDVQEIDLTFEGVPDQSESDDGDDQTDGTDTPEAGTPDDQETPNGDDGSGDGSNGGGGGSGGGGGGGSGGGGAGGGGGGGAAGGSDTGSEDDAGGAGPATDVAQALSEAPVVSEASAEVTVEDGSNRAAVTFDADTSPVDSITFESDAVEGTVTVAEIDREATETSVPGAAASVSRIDVPDSATDQAATVRMRVPTDRLSELDAEPSELRANRFVDGEWQALETTVAEETDSAVVLEAETPGFSYFSVSAVSEPDAAITLDPATSTSGSSVTLDGSDSTTEHGEIVAYDWTANGESYEGETATTAFDEPGEYEVELTVTNDAGETDTATETLVVEAATESAPSDQETQPPATSGNEDGSESGSGNGDGDDGGLPLLWIAGGIALAVILLGAVVRVRADDGPTRDPL